MVTKILNFNLDTSVLKENQLVLSSTIRNAIFEIDRNLKEVFDNDAHLHKTFLEPMLFYLALKQKKKILLKQILLGYYPFDSKELISAYSDSQGFIFLPQIGYIKVKENSRFTIGYSKVENKIEIDGEQFSIIKEDFINDSDIKLYHHLPIILEESPELKLNEPIKISTEAHKTQIHQALNLLRRNTPEFYKLIQGTVKYFSIFNSTSPNSFAAISYHGAAFFNTENTIQSEVFFVDDIAHQCGHVIYNALTLRTSEFLKHPKETLLNGVIKNLDDHRTALRVLSRLGRYHP